MMPRTTCQRAVPIGVQSQHRQLHHGLVRGVETVLGAEGIELRVLDVAFSGGEQLRDRLPIRLDLVEADAQQVFQVMVISDQEILGLDSTFCTNGSLFATFGISTRVR